MIVKEKVRFVETDMMGVVHHANYFRWFEVARVEYLRQAGISLLDLMAQDIVVPIVEVNCNYKASAKFDDLLVIKTTLTELNPAKMVFAYEIMRDSDNKLLATGSTKNVFSNGAGNIVRLPKQYYLALQAVVAADKVD